VVVQFPKIEDVKNDTFSTRFTVLFGKFPGFGDAGIQDFQPLRCPLAQGLLGVVIDFLNSNPGYWRSSNQFKNIFEG
jgi:hypothetical protein